MPTPDAPNSPAYPYKIAVLCDLRDRGGRVLLIKRAKEPNRGLYSPIGGKLDTASGESPARCAQREIHEEAGLLMPIERLRLVGIISERGFQGQTNWLMFWYRVTGSVEVGPRSIVEGELEWHPLSALDALPLPETDRKVIWPLVRAHDPGTPGAGTGFFCVHVVCDGPELVWTVEQSDAPGGVGPPSA